jgi:predicted transcriptional regulator
MTLIDALRAKIAESTQTEVAAEIGITQPMLSMLLSGKRRAGKDTLTSIIAAYPHLYEACADYWMEMLGEEKR